MTKVFRFDDFVLDGETFELRRGEAQVPVEPLVLDLLVLLLDRSGAVVSRDALVASVWKGRFVSDTTISTAIKWARKALGDSGIEQKYLRTVRGRGIQFVGQLESGLPLGDGNPRWQASAATRPALYVRPFDTIDEPGLKEMALALRARLSMVLARIPLLCIVTPFPRVDQLSDPLELRNRWGVSHLLDVHLAHVDQGLSADVTLTETRNGLQVWSQRFETPTGPSDQEILLHKIIRRLEPRMVQAMVVDMDAQRGCTDAGSLLLQAIALLALSGWNRATFVEATEMIEKSIGLEPNLALSHAYLALVRALGHRVGLLRSDDQLVPAVIAEAERALELENQDSTILGLVGCALADVGQVERALPMLKKSIEADPLNGHAKTALGAALMMKQDYKAAARHLAQGIACSPADSRLSVWGTALALAQLALGEVDDALESATDACREDDRIYLPRLALAGIHLVRKEQAQAVAATQEVLRTKPDLNQIEAMCVLGERLGGGVWTIAQSLMESTQKTSKLAASSKSVGGA